LGVLDHELVGFLAHEKIHTDTPVTSGGDGLEHGVVGHEIW